MVDLLLACDMALGAARELDVLLPAHHLPDRFGLRTFGIPHVDGEDHRVAARLVVEHRLDRRIGVDAAVPVGVAVDAHRGKRRRQRARRHDVIHCERLVAAVEIAHFATLDVDRPDRQSRFAAVEVLDIDELGERCPQGRGRVIGGAVKADGHVGTEPRCGVRSEKGREPMHHGRQVGHRARDTWHELQGIDAGMLLDPRPELVQTIDSMLRRIACDDRPIDGADRCADHPIGLDPRLVQRFVDADLVGAQRAAALQDQHDLPGQHRRGGSAGAVAAMRAALS